MRRLLNLAILLAVVVVIAASPALAKKAPIQRTVIDGVTLAEVKPNTQIEPFYPATARTAKPYAVVIVAAEVDAKGKVRNVDVLSTSVEGMGFGMSAKDAVRQWRFLPALENGQAIDSVSVVRLTFAPPTLRRPEGFVFTERSPQFFAVNMFQESLDARMQARSLAGGQSFSADPSDYYFPSDLPPCKPTRSGNECMYNKQDMRQFGSGSDGVIGLPPHYQPPTSINPGNEVRGRR